MNNRKVIFIDYDGTLYSEKHKRPSYRIKELLKLALESEIDIYLSTGRTLLTLAHEEEILANVKGVLGANGSFIYENKKMVYINYINKKEISYIYNYSKNNAVDIAFFSKTCAYTCFNDKSLIERFKTFNKVNIVDIYDTFIINEEIELICLYSQEELIDKLIPHFPNLTVYKWGSRGADVVNKGSTKGKAIQEVIKMNNYHYSNTYGIGDGLNDIEMFQSVNHSVAMGNASSYVKQHAKYITNNIEEDGLEDILEDIIYGKM